MFPSHHLPHIHMKLFFWLEWPLQMSSLIEKLIAPNWRRAYSNAFRTNLPNSQITFHLLSFFLYLYPTFCSQYPQLLPGKLFNVHAVSPEQHHATEQVKIQPKGRAAQNTPSLPLFLLWSWTRASKGSSLLVLAWAVARLRVISSSCDNLVWALCSPNGRWGFLNLGAKKLMSATSQGTPKAESYFLHVNQDFAGLICLPYLNSCNTGAACSLAMAC